VSEQAIAAPISVERRVEAHGATLRAVFIIWYRDLLRFTRDRARLLISFVQPLLYLLIFGTGLSSALRGATGSLGAGSLNYQQFIYPGIIGMSVLFSAIFGAMSIVWDREFGFLKEVLVAPINRSAVAIGKTLGGATQSMLQAVVLLAIAPIIGVKLTLLGVVELVPMIFVFAFAVSALGVAVGARIRTLQGFQVVTNFIMLPIFFLAGALFPLNNLPAWMTVLTRLNPGSYAIDPLRRTVLGAGGVPESVLDRLGLTLFGQTLSVWTEEALVFGFGLAMLAAAVYGFRQRD